VDALLWLSRATLDVIGLAGSCTPLPTSLHTPNPVYTGFGYTFDSLVDDSNELANAFSVIFSTARKFRVITILQVWFPFLRKFVRFSSITTRPSQTHLFFSQRRNSETMKQAKETMNRIGLGLIEDKMKEVLAEQPMSDAKSSSIPLSIDAEKTLLGRDILSVLSEKTFHSSLKIY
jgi:hypothetical protein